MTIVDFEALGGKQVDTTRAPVLTAGSHVIARSQLRSVSDDDQPTVNFPVKCVRGALHASTQMMTGVDGGKYILVTVPNLKSNKADGGDSDPTLPQLRRDAIRYGTSLALELLRREAVYAKEEGHAIVLNSHLASSIARRLNVNEQKRHELEQEMQLEIRRANARARIMQEKSRMDIARVDALFINRNSS